MEQIYRIEDWHIARNAIKQLISREFTKGMRNDFYKHERTSENCIEEELTDIPYPKSTDYRARKILDIVHSDVSGPIQTYTSYILTFVDDQCTFTMKYLISKKMKYLQNLEDMLK